MYASSINDEAFLLIASANLVLFKPINNHCPLFELCNYLFESDNNASISPVYLCVISS